MRTIVLLNDVDAGVAVTSQHIDFEQDSRWLLQITSTGLNGTPRIVIEESIDNAELVWTPLFNPKNSLFFFEIDDSPIGVKDSYLMGKFFRVRLEPNGNTTGTIKADLGYKTKV